jgi:hypothetical protein
MGIEPTSSVPHVCESTHRSSSIWAQLGAEFWPQEFAYVVFSDGATKPVSRVAADSAQQDLIVLAVDTGSRSAVKFGDEMSLHQGDSVYALGAPEGLQLTFTNGIVSSFRKSNAQFLIQTTAPIAHGSSGGPLFDSTGRVVGVTTSMLSDAPGIYFSVGIGDVRRLLRTSQGVALPFEEWAKNQGNKSDSASKDGPGERQHAGTGALTLRETISWMQDFSQAHGVEWVDGKLLGRNAIFQGLPFQKPSAPGCAVLIRHDYYVSHSAEVDGFDFSEVNPENIQFDEIGVVWFETTDPKGKISQAIVFDQTITPEKPLSLLPEAGAKAAKGEARTIESVESRGHLSFDSVASAKRFATALRHAVGLCGGTASPF